MACNFMHIFMYFRQDGDRSGRSQTPSSHLYSTRMDAVLPSDPPPTRQFMRALRHRDYRLFFGGQIISLVGNFLTATATAWLVFRLATEAGHGNQAGRWLGLVGFATQFPLFVLAPFAGVWVDRIDRRRLLVVTQGLAMVQSLSLAMLGFTHIEYWHVVLLATFQGLINAFDIPARQAFLVEIVRDRRDLPNAIALNSSMVHSARLIGPAAAGFLIYYFGEKICFLMDGLSYIAVIVALLMMHPPAVAVRKKGRSVLSELKEGARYVWGFTPIRSVLILMATVSLTITPAFITLAPVFAGALGGRTLGSRTLGWIMASSGMGALVGAILLAMRHSVVGLGRMIAVAAMLYAVALGLFGWVGSMEGGMWRLAFALPCGALSGYAMITTLASANTVIQTLADDDKRVRVMSLF